MAKKPGRQDGQANRKKAEFIGPNGVRAWSAKVGEIALRLNKVADKLEAEGAEIRPLPGNLSRVYEALSLIIEKEFELKARSQDPRQKRRSL